MVEPGTLVALRARVLLEGAQPLRCEPGMATAGAGGPTSIMAGDGLAGGEVSIMAGAGSDSGGSLQVGSGTGALASGDVLLKSADVCGTRAQRLLQADRLMFRVG